MKYLMLTLFSLAALVGKGQKLDSLKVDSLKRGQAIQLQRKLFYPRLVNIL